VTGRLDDRVAIITGAAAGQGEAQVRLFAAEGARVVIADSAELRSAGEALAEEVGPAATFYGFDVADEQAWARLVAATVDRWDRLDVLVNGPGTNHTALMLDTDVADFERVVRTNQLGPWLGMRAVAPAMAASGGGSIVNIISASVVVGLVGKSVYAGSKHAMRGMSAIAARELGAMGIRVNAVLPGGIATPALEARYSSADELNEQFADQPIPRIGRSEEVAQTVLFLASDEASYCTGAEVLVDGGLTAAPLPSPLTEHRPHRI
jgi:3alpha(or 20beta)-hydroxysteroid dehydrogenase